MNALYELPRHPAVRPLAGLGLLMGFMAWVNPAPTPFFAIIALRLGNCEGTWKLGTRRSRLHHLPYNPSDVDEVDLAVGVLIAVLVGVVRLPVPPELQAALDVLPEPRGADGDSRYFFWSGHGSVRAVVRDVARTRTVSGIPWPRKYSKWAAASKTRRRCWGTPRSISASTTRSGRCAGKSASRACYRTFSGYKTGTRIIRRR